MESHIRLKLMGVVHCCEAILPHMKKRRYGKIVNIASMAGHAPRLRGGAYAASKAAVLRYTKGLAHDVASMNLNTNAVCPGAVWTAFQQSASGLDEPTSYEAFLERYKSVIPMGRPQSTEDVGKAVTFLASRRRS